MSTLNLRVVHLWHPDQISVTIEIDASATLGALLEKCVRSISSVRESELGLYKSSLGSLGHLEQAQSLSAHEVCDGDTLVCWYTDLEYKEYNLHGVSMQFGNMCHQWAKGVVGDGDETSKYGLKIAATKSDCIFLPALPGHMKHIRYLDFRSQAYDENFFIRIPDSVTQFTSLRTLVAHKIRPHGKGDPADYLPRTLPSSLTHVDIAQNSLTHMPQTWSNLHGLITLIMGQNSFTQVPTAVLHLHSLKNLDLSRNKIFTLPIEISNLCALEDLNVSDNALEQLPDTMRSMRSLRALRASGNSIAHLSPDFSKPGCFTLDLLDLSNNAFASFPQHFPYGVNRVLLNGGNAGERISSIRSPISGLGRCSHLELTYHQIDAQDVICQAGLSSLADTLPDHCTVILSGRLRENDLCIGNDRVRRLSPQVLRAILRQQTSAQQRPELNIHASQSRGNAGNGCEGSIANILATLHLSQWLTALETLGVTEPTFLGELREDDLEAIGMPPIHRRRLLRSAASWSLPTFVEEPATKRARRT